MTIENLFNTWDFITPDIVVVVWDSISDKENDTDKWYKCEAGRIWNSTEVVAKFGFNHGFDTIYIALAK